MPVPRSPCYRRNVARRSRHRTSFPVPLHTYLTPEIDNHGLRQTHAKLFSHTQTHGVVRCVAYAKVPSAERETHLTREIIRGIVWVSVTAHAGASGKAQAPQGQKTSPGHHFHILVMTVGYSLCGNKPLNRGMYGPVSRANNFPHTREWFLRPQTTPKRGCPPLRNGSLKVTRKACRFSDMRIRRYEFRGKNNTETPNPSDYQQKEGTLAGKYEHATGYFAHRRSAGWTLSEVERHTMKVG